MNEALWGLLCSTTSERAAALLLGVNRKLVARRIPFFAAQALQAHQKEQEARALRGALSTEIQFDEMETFEHTKCKPLSIGLCVDAKTREILSLSVASMPASGPLAELSRGKYGKRADDRRAAAETLFQSLTGVVHPRAHLQTDQNPKYPAWFRPWFPELKHTAYKGRRPTPYGQGELKRGGFDPLFALNHTAAMIRARVSRLIRRTWNTTKKPERLLDRLWIYAHFHNTRLLPPRLSLG